MKQFFVIFLILSIFVFCAVLFCKIRAFLKNEKAKNMEAAKKYFATICYKLLTPFTDEKTAKNYITFRIYGDELVVIRMIHNYEKEAPLRTVFLLKVKFCYSIIINAQTNARYSYSGFETLLNMTVGDSVVCDEYIKLLCENTDILKRPQ